MQNRIRKSSKCMLVFTLLITCSFITKAQDALYTKAWREVYATIADSFDKIIKDSSPVIEQTAIVVLEIKNGKVDTFNIWSMYDKEKSNWLIQFFKPLINKYYRGFLPYSSVVIPVRVYDLRKDERDTLSGEHFIMNFAAAFRHKARSGIIVSQGIVLSTSWVVDKIKR
jgi:hypothetical protein